MPEKNCAKVVLLSMEQHWSLARKWEQVYTLHDGGGRGGYECIPSRKIRIE